jgi:hypothetical protein
MLSGKQGGDMPVYKEMIDRRIKGSLAENEDYWYLCYDSDADAFYVEHQWDHMNPYKLTEKGDSGESRHDAETWTGAGHDKIEATKQKLLEKARA